MKKIILIVMFSLSFIYAGNKSGELDGTTSQPYNIRSMADWYDLRYTIVDSLANDTMLCGTMFGAGVLVKGFVNMSGTAGYVYFKTVTGSMIQKWYLAPWESTPKLPVIKYIYKTSTIDTLGCFFQVQNQ